jgi:hypothetical protein
MLEDRDEKIIKTVDSEGMGEGQRLKRPERTGNAEGS